MKKKEAKVFHQPALLNETLKFLNVQPGERYIDATIGGGGHSGAIIEKGGGLLGIDADPKAVSFVSEKLTSELKTQSSKFQVVQGNFRNLEKIAKENNFDEVAGILFDLGMSTWQIKGSGRGFSFQGHEPLDMRMNPELKVTAADLVNGLNKGELIKLFRKYGEEKHAKAIAQNIIDERQLQPITTNYRLVEIINHSKPKDRKIHPATKVFQALRIAVNDELNNLKKALPQARDTLKPGGRLVVISFHSLEDRIVKHFFKKGEQEGILSTLTPTPVTASEEEVKKNPSARSAKLRAAEKSRA